MEPAAWRDRLVASQGGMPQGDDLAHLVAIHQVLDRQHEIGTRSLGHVLAHDRVRVLPNLRELLIQPARWPVQRDDQIGLLGVPSFAAEFLEPLLADLVAGMSAVAEAQRRGKIEIGSDGMPHLPAITARADQSEPVCTGETKDGKAPSCRMPPPLRYACDHLDRLTELARLALRSL